jgi:hypothetical protein
MKYISEQTRLNITTTIYSSVCGMFSTMLHEENRGENFDWNSDVIINYACDMVFVHHHINDKLVKNYECSVKDYSRKLATEIYETMIKNAGYKK